MSCNMTHVGQISCPHQFFAKVIQLPAIFQHSVFFVLSKRSTHVAELSIHNCNNHYRLANAQLSPGRERISKRNLLDEIGRQPFHLLNNIIDINVSMADTLW